MTVIKMSVNARSLNFANQQKVVVLRDVHGMTWAEIRKQVVNLRNEKPAEQTVVNVYNKFDKKQGHTVFKYENSGRKPWKVTPLVEKFLLSRLLVFRRQCICTSTTLQEELAKKHGAFWRLRRSEEFCRRTATNGCLVHKSQFSAAASVPLDVIGLDRL